MVYGSTTSASSFEDDNIEVLAWLPALLFILAPCILLLVVLCSKCWRKTVVARAIRKFSDPKERAEFRRRMCKDAEGDDEANAATKEDMKSAWTVLDDFRKLNGEGEEEKPVPPAFRVFISFDNMHYRVKIGGAMKLGRRKELHILKGAKGWIKSGELTAIMGSSGGGKTTLMNALTGRTHGGCVSGDIRVNGLPPVSSFFQQCGFVYQFEVLTPELTVRETLMYAASLLLPPDMTMLDKYMTVEKVMAEVGITHVARNRIGSDLKPGISGGQLKRVGIAVELLRNPTVLFLDEPTSGLDALTSLSLLKTLQSLAKSGRAIAFTIHQPRQEIFEMFDSLILVKDGRVAFQGNRQSTVRFLAGLARQSHMYYTNMGDFVADAVCAPSGSPFGLLEGIDCAKTFQSSAHGSLISSRIKTIHQKKQLYGNFPNIQPAKVNVFTQSIALAERMWDVYWRRPDLFITELLRSTGTAILLGVTFWQLGDSYTDTASRNGLLFFMTTYVLLNAALGVSTYHEHIKVFRREHATGLVSSNSLLAAAFIVDIPRESFFTFVFASLTYLMTGIGATFEEYCYFVLLSILAGITSTSFLSPIAVLSRDQVVANIVWVMALTIMSIFSGFLITSDDIPEYLQWLHYVAFHSWVYGGYLDVVLRERSVNFVPQTPSCDLVTQQVSLCNANSCSSFASTCPSSGSNYISFLKMDHMNVYIALLFCLGVAIFFRLCGFAILNKFVLRRTFKIKLETDDSNSQSKESNNPAMSGLVSLKSMRKVDLKNMDEIFFAKGQKALHLSDHFMERLIASRPNNLSVGWAKRLYWSVLPCIGNRNRAAFQRQVSRVCNDNYNQVERILNFSGGGTLWMRAIFATRTRRRMSNNMWRDITQVNSLASMSSAPMVPTTKGRKERNALSLFGHALCARLNADE